MTATAECCRYEPSLEDLLDDEVMATVLRSAGYDSQGFREMMAATARRIDAGRNDRPGMGHRSEVDGDDDGCEIA